MMARGAALARARLEDGTYGRDVMGADGYYPVVRRLSVLMVATSFHPNSPIGAICGVQLKMDYRAASGLTFAGRFGTAGGQYRDSFRVSNSVIEPVRTYAVALMQKNLILRLQPDGGYLFRPGKDLLAASLAGISKGCSAVFRRKCLVPGCQPSRAWCGAELCQQRDFDMLFGFPGYERLLNRSRFALL